MSAPENPPGRTDGVPLRAKRLRRRVIHRTLLRYTGLALVAVILSVAWLWALLALWFFDPWPVWMRALAMAVWVAATVCAYFLLSRRRAAQFLAVGLGLVLPLWLFRSPSNQKVWREDQARMPVAQFDGKTVTLRNLRYASYRAAEDFDVTWYEDRFHLAAIRSVDFVVEPFADWRGPAHTLLTFGFDDGRHLAVSVEARRERGESFRALTGLFKRYEILYVIGDERDLIGLRLNVRKHDVYVFPIRAERRQIQELFVRMLDRANKLVQRPEFYQTFTNSCHMNIVRHFEDLTGRKLPLDLRIYLPGYADEMAFEMGLIDFEGTLEAARAAFRIPGPVPVMADGRDWSRRIRGRR
jgi:hypothetical protein